MFRIMLFGFMGFDLASRDYSDPTLGIIMKGFRHVLEEYQDIWTLPVRFDQSIQILYIGLWTPLDT